MADNNSNQSPQQSAQSGMKKSARDHQKPTQEIARHSRDIKPESDYTKGGVEGDGQDARRSRQKAIRFQEDLANE